MEDSLAVKVLKNAIHITTTLNSKIVLEQRLDAQLEKERLNKIG